MLGRLEDLREKLLLLLDGDHELVGRAGDLRRPGRSLGHHQLGAGAGQSGEKQPVSHLTPGPKYPFSWKIPTLANTGNLNYLGFLAQINPDWPMGSEIFGGGEKR